jgi:hypothetical protein
MKRASPFSQPSTIHSLFFNEFAAPMLKLGNITNSMFKKGWCEIYSKDNHGRIM